MSRVLALDPGDKLTGFCLIEKDTLKPVKVGKVENKEMLRLITEELDYQELVLERVASYGMNVGKSIFQTCEWVGRFVQAAIDWNKNIPIGYVYRKDEKLHICMDSRAKDTNIRRALIDRFALHDFKNGKGRKSNPDWFYGFSGSDMYAAYACGLVYIEKGASEVEK